MRSFSVLPVSHTSSLLTQRRAVAWSAEGVLAFATRNHVDLHRTDNASNGFLSLGTLRGHKDKVVAVEFLSEVSRKGVCVSLSRDGDVRVWDVSSRTCLRVFPCRPLQAICMGISRDRLRWIICGGKYAKLSVRDISGSDDSASRSFSVDESRADVVSLSNVFMCDDVYYVVVGLYNGHLRVVDVRKGVVSCSLVSPHTKTVQHLALNAPQDVLASSSGDGTLAVWDVRSWTLLKTVKLCDSKSRLWATFAWLPRQLYVTTSGRLGVGNALVVSGERMGDVDVVHWQWTTAGESGVRQMTEWSRRRLGRGHKERPVFNIVARPPRSNEDGRVRDVVTIGMDRTICRWDVARGACISKHGALGGFAYSVDASSSDDDQYHLFVAAGDGMLRILTTCPREPASHSLCHVWQGLSKRRVTSVSSYPPYVACGTDSGHVYVYDVAREIAGSQIMTKQGNTSSCVRMRVPHSTPIEQLQWFCWNAETSSTKKKTDTSPVDDRHQVALLYVRSQDGHVSEIDPLFPKVDAVRMDQRWEMTARVDCFQWHVAQLRESHHTCPLLAAATRSKDETCVHISIRRGSSESVRGSRMNEMLKWVFPCSDYGATNRVSPSRAGRTSPPESRARCRSIKWRPSVNEADQRCVAIAIERIVWILHISVCDDASCVESRTWRTTSHHDRTLTGHSDVVLDMSWRQLRRDDGQNEWLLLTTSSDRTAQIWNTASCTPLRNLRGHTGSVLCGRWLRTSPIDEDHEDRDPVVITGSADHSVRVWNIHEQPYTAPPTRRRSECAHPTVPGGE